MQRSRFSHAGQSSNRTAKHPIGWIFARKKRNPAIFFVLKHYFCPQIMEYEKHFYLQTVRHGDASHHGAHADFRKRIHAGRQFRLAARSPDCLRIRGNKLSLQSKLHLDFTVYQRIYARPSQPERASPPGQQRVGHLAQHHRPLSGSKRELPAGLDCIFRQQI